jgi:glucose/arabinose dehydrogenase
MTWTLVVDGLNRPVYAASPVDDFERLFVLEHKSGLVRIVKDGAILPTPFLDLSAKLAINWQQGAFSIAFHPDYAANGYCYVYYSDVNEDSVLERYTVSAGDPNVADPASALIVMAVLQPDDIHNGGMASFGPDGYLYWALGDGGPQFDPNCMGQTTASPLGKLLRLDVDGGTPYAVPPTNPFAGAPGYFEEIWAMGLRNPWRFSWDRLTGELFISDVGQNTMEEVSVEPTGFLGGANYGWSMEEGTSCHTTNSCPPAVPPCGDSSYTPPAHAYAQVGLRCSIIGGYVYRGCAVPQLYGRYLFADWCSGEFLSFRYQNGLAVDFLDHTVELGPRVARPVSFAEDAAGELFVMDHFDGQLFRLASEGGTAYCTAKTSSIGCTPTIASTGSATLATEDDLLVTAAGINGQSKGVLLFGTRVNPTPATSSGSFGTFGSSLGGTQFCVLAPGVVGRKSSGGTAGACDGSYLFRLTHSFLAKSGLGPCEPLYLQWYFEDPTHPDGTGTGHTGALELLMGP